MKLDHIKIEHLEKAAAFIDRNGIPEKHLSNQYWIVFNNTEYPFKYLIQIAHQQTAKTDHDWLEFQSKDEYREYFKVKFKLVINYYSGWINFFSQKEIELFNTVVDKKYRKGSEVSQRLGLKILPLFYKTEYWASALNIEGFIVQPDYKWQISGTFKPYTWARIYRKEDQDRKIFFTVGVDGKSESLVYKLDCLWSQTNKAKALSPDQVTRFRKFLQGTNTGREVIRKDDVINYDWDRLIIESKRFIENNITLYDEVIKYVWAPKEKILNSKLDSELNLELPPDDGYNELPLRKASFKGTNRDFLKESIRNKTFGDAGEDLVIKYERKKLIKAGKLELAEQVKKVADGKGYDILSFSPDKTEKHIGVKTTTSSRLKPFPVSWTEIEYM